MCATNSNLTAAGRHVTHQTWQCTRHGFPLFTLSHMHRTRAEFIIKSCSVLVRLVTIKGAPCSTSLRMRVSARSIVLPGTVQRGRSEAGNAADPRKPCNFEMHGPCPSCSGARGAPCSTDCMSVVLHGSVWCSYLPLAETFPLCFDEGEGKHKRLCLLSRSLPPSPSHWSFSRSRFFFFATKMQKNQLRSSCTWSPFASEACASVQGATVQMHGAHRRRGKRLFCKCTAKNSPQHLHDGPRAGS